LTRTSQATIDKFLLFHCSKKSFYSSRKRLFYGCYQCQKDKRQAFPPIGRPIYTKWILQILQFNTTTSSTNQDSTTLTPTNKLLWKFTSNHCNNLKMIRFSFKALFFPTFINQKSCVINGRHEKYHVN